MPPCQQSSLVDKHPLSCEEPTHWKRSDSLEKTPMLGKTKGRRRKGQQRIRWLDGIPDSVDMHLSKLGNSEGQGSLACCSPWGHQESDMTGQLNNISCPSGGRVLRHLFYARSQCQRNQALVDQGSGSLIFQTHSATPCCYLLVLPFKYSH